MAPRDLLSVILIMAVFGSAYVVGKLGVGHFPPFAFAALRSAILALALIPLFRFELPDRTRWPALAGFCLTMGTAVYAAMYLALMLTHTVAPIIIGTQLSVPFAVLLGLLVLKEPVGWATWIAILAAFSGVVVIAFDPALVNDLPALGAIAVSAFSYALATMFARALRGVSAFAMNGWMAISAILPLGLLSLMFEDGQWQAIRTAGWLQWGVLLHSALVVSLVGHVWMFSLYRRYAVATVIPFYVLMPVFGVAMSQLVFAETPTLQTWIGGAIVLAATYAVNRITTRDRETRVARAR
ncbi:DMT family transporter [Rhodovibrio salinarum]|nr:DMT family transporter [Rhodovibrio salinarum]